MRNYPRRMAMTVEASEATDFDNAASSEATSSVDKSSLYL
jgi:hypothetical protein